MNDSTLLTTVGREKSPAPVMCGGRARGLGRWLSSALSIADASPQM